ncbi:MAG: hypothetical protein JWO82_2230, partial [Akkermansiaceae bacterium]|nr:hypothetical protein [Akkermansiaceae bacterium]
MRTFSTLAVVASSVLCMQCTRLGPVAGSDEAVGVWGSQQPIQRGSGGAYVGTGPSSAGALIRQVNLKVDYVPKNSRFRRNSRP